MYFRRGLQPPSEGVTIGSARRLRAYVSFRPLERAAGEAEARTWTTHNNYQSQKQAAMIVMKFGGTSVGSAEAIQRVAGIVAERASGGGVVVVSAMGKTTDELLKVAHAAAAGKREQALTLLEQLHQRDGRTVAEVVDRATRAEADAFLERHYVELAELVKGLAVLGELTPRSIDAFSSYGERISSFVVTLALRTRGLDSAHADSRRLIVTDDRFTEAAPLLGPTNMRLINEVAPLVEQGKVVVMGGFIAATEQGVTTTLGRGGSDFTAALVGAALGAEEVQIWTDVDGVLTADPSMLPEARRLRVVSFEEASELAYFGARVLHPSTMLPAIRSNIPVRVLNSHRPSGEGTLIVAEAPPVSSHVKSIAYKENITVVNIHSTRMLMAHGFLAKIFDVFERYRTAVDMVTTSEVSVSLTIDRTERLAEISAELEKFAQVSHTAGQAIVCVVGENLRHTPGIAAKMFQALEDINILMISQGASRLNVSFVIDEKDLERAIQALHQTFFSQIDKKVFA